MFPPWPQIDETFDPEIGEHVFWNAVMNGDWYVSQANRLYINPTEEDGGMELLGPDDEIADAINKAIRESSSLFSSDGKLSPEEATQLGLSLVPQEHKYFHPQRGYWVEYWP